MVKFHGIVVRKTIKNELEEIGVKNIEYIPMRDINRTNNRYIKDLYKFKIKNLLVFYNRIDPDKILRDMDIACEMIRHVACLSPKE